VNGTLLKILPGVLRVAVGAGCLALLWQFADGAAALGYLATADTAWMAMALVMLTLQTLLSAMRWRLTAQQLGIGLDRGPAVREYYLSQIVNQVLPGGVLGDAGRAVRARAQAGLLASGQAVVFERLAGQIGLLVVFTAAVAGTWAVPGGFRGPHWLLGATLCLPVAGATVFALCYLPGRMRVFMLPGLKMLPARVVRAVKGFVAAFAHSVAAPQVRVRQGFMSLGTALCNIAAFACCATAIGAPLPVPAALVLIPLVLVTMLIPLTPAGWGLREGAAAALLPLAGATSAEGLAASVAFGLTLLVSTLPGLFALASAAVPAPVKS
jgi:uncharacterized membrane protein YbhN (UPF0104 family)